MKASTTQTTLLTGATGYIGSRLASRLLDAGYRIRCVVRCIDKARARSWAIGAQFGQLRAARWAGSGGLVGQGCAAVPGSGGAPWRRHPGGVQKNVRARRQSQH